MNKRRISSLVALALAGTIVFGLAACGHSSDNCDDACMTGSCKSKVDTIVVIYAENRSFDNLYGLFPGRQRHSGRERVGHGHDLAAARPQCRRRRARDAAARPGAASRQRASSPWSPRHRATTSPTRRFASTTDLRHRAARVVHARPRTTASSRTRCRSTAARTTSSPRYADSGGLVMGYYDGSSHGDVEDRPAVRARRQLLHGRVRRLVPQPPVPDLRLRARVSERRHRRGEAHDRDARHGRVAASSLPKPHARGDLAGVGARRPAHATRSTGNIVAEELLRRRHVPRGQHDAAAYQPSGNAPAAGDTTGLYADPAAADDAAAADADDHRRPARREERHLDVVRAARGRERLGRPRA